MKIRKVKKKIKKALRLYRKSKYVRVEKRLRKCYSARYFAVYLQAIQFGKTNPPLFLMIKVGKKQYKVARLPWS